MNMGCIAALAAVFLLMSGPSAFAQDEQPQILYPRAALEQGIGGTAGVECVVRTDGGVDCAITQEMPTGMGFGDAVLAMSNDWRMATQTSDGTPTAGRRLRRVVRFVPGPPPSVQDVTDVQTIWWVERPGAQDFARLYPLGAIHDGVEGRVNLDCTVRPDHRLDCTIASEEPVGRGFGQATLRLAEKFRMADQTRQGQDTVGGRVRVPIRWNIAH